MRLLQLPAISVISTKTGAHDWTIISGRRLCASIDIYTKNPYDAGGYRPPRMISIGESQSNSGRCRKDTKPGNVNANGQNNNDEKTKTILLQTEEEEEDTTTSLPLFIGQERRSTLGYII